MKIYYLTFLVSVIALTGSCKRSGDETKISEIEKEKIVNEFREMNKRVNEIHYRFPTPDEMFTFINISSDLKKDICRILNILIIF